MHRYAAVLLDVDGTLVDSNDAHAHAWVETFAEYGIEVSFERVRRMIGMGGDRVIEQLAGHRKDGQANEQISERRSQLFRERWLPRARPLPGARELLLRLRAEGYEYAIATAAKDEELQPLLELAGIADLCDRRTTSSDVEETKPDPAIVDAALERVAAQRGRVVMLGDTPYDIEAARGARVDIIGFTSGGWRPDELAGSVAVYDGPAGLLARWDSSPLA
jgi:HAD superfamily hydrolase (TIGR01509 family)